MGRTAQTWFAKQRRFADRGLNMPDPNKPVEEIIDALEERAKELNCLYRIEELLNHPEITLEDTLEGVVRAIPPGWQYPESCQARITLRQVTCASSGFRKTPWVQKADIVIQGEVVGTIEVSYTRKRPHMDEGPFLNEERRLINTIAERLGHFVLHKDLVCALDECWKHIDTTRVELVGKFLRMLADKLNVQLLFCSHHDIMTDFSDKTYRVDLDAAEGKSSIDVF